METGFEIDKIHTQKRVSTSRDTPTDHRQTYTIVIPCTDGEGDRNTPPHENTLKEVPPTMTTEPKQTQQRSILIDLIQCACCGTSMVLDQADYVCPNSNHQNDGIIPSVNAEQLNHLVISTLIERILTPDNLSKIVESIQRCASRKIATHRQTLDETESAMETLNWQRNKIMNQVKHQGTPYTQVAHRIASIEATRAGLAHESATAQDQIEMMKWVSNLQGIQSVAMDIDTYTKSGQPALIKEIAQISIKDVQVAANSLTLHYTDLYTGPTDNQLTTFESFPLPLTIAP